MFLSLLYLIVWFTVAAYQHTMPAYLLDSRSDESVAMPYKGAVLPDHLCSRMQSVKASFSEVFKCCLFPVMMPQQT